MKSYRSSGRLGDALETVVEQIQEGVKRGQFTLGELQGAVLEKSKETARTTDEFVHEHSWKVIGAVALGGILLGLLLNRR